MIEIFNKVKYILGNKFYIIFILIINSFFIRILDLIGIASVVAICTTFIETKISNQSLSFLDKISFLSINQRLFFIFFIVLLRLLVLIILKFISYKIIFKFITELRSYLIYCYLQRPLSTINKINSSYFIQSAYESAGKVNTNLIQPSSNLIADVLFSFIVFLVLGLYDSKLLIMLIAFSLTTYFSQKAISRFLSRTGRNDTLQSQKVIAVIREAIYSYPESKIKKLSYYFYKKSLESSKRLAKVRVNGALQKFIPSILIESIMLISIVIYTFYLVKVGKSNLIPEALTILAVALSRLYPVFSQINYALTRLKFGVNALDRVLNDLKIYGLNHSIYYSLKDKYKENDYSDLQDFNEIALENISYGYEENKNNIENISLLIKKNTITLIKGESGKGKSTLIKLIAGILKPKSGKILINGKENKIYENKNWFQIISYVQQDPFILDGSILENICIGVPKKSINKDLLNYSIKISQLEDVISQCKGGINFYVGENGDLLSGGQKQRLVLARFLYYNSKILIMDEPTSSLDSDMARSFFELLKLLKQEITIIMISHWEEAGNYADQIFEL